MGVGSTTGECITKAARFYVNAGSSIVAQDQDLRERCLHFLKEEAAGAWALYPWWFKNTDGTVTVPAGGIGPMPSDFARMGIDARVYYSNGLVYQPLQYVAPFELLDMFQQDSTQSPLPPSYYTLHTQTTTGIPNLQIYGVNNASLTIQIRNYERQLPDLIDYPAAPVIVDSGVAGNPNGAYLYKATFVTALGETDPSNASASLTVSSKKITVTLATAPSHNVTARKLYRTVAGGTDFHLLATISDNVTTTYLDNIADASISATAAPPTPATAVTGMEQIPPDFHDSVFVRGLMNRLMGSQGDPREMAWGTAWEARLKRMWAEEKQGQNQGWLMPVFGQGSGLDTRGIRQRMPK